MKRLMAAALIVAVLTLAGCETMNGFGRDMQTAGNWIEHKATKASQVRKQP